MTPWFHICEGVARRTAQAQASHRQLASRHHRRSHPLLTLSDKIFSLNLGTALISSSVSIPMSATVPGPIVETSLPSTAGRVACQYASRSRATSWRCLPCTQAPVTFCSTARIVLSAMGEVLVLTGEWKASCGEEVKVQRLGGRRFVQEEGRRYHAASCGELSCQAYLLTSVQGYTRSHVLNLISFEDDAGRLHIVAQPRASARASHATVRPF